MSPRGTFDLGEGPAPGTWTLDESDPARPQLLLAPEGRPPEAVDLREVRGITGDGYSLELTAGLRAVRLTKLGADGPTLRETLRRLWPPLRAAALRLDAAGDQACFEAVIDLGAATPQGGGAARAGAPAAGLVLALDHALLAAPDGGDLEPAFLSHLASLRPLDAGYALECTRWDGGHIVFSRLAAKTEAFISLVTEKRARLAAEAAQVLAANLPALGPAERAGLAARWLPGRVVSLAELEAVTPGARAQIEASWLTKAPRAAEARTLVADHPPEAVYAGYTRPGAEPPPADAAESADSAEEPPAESPHTTEPASVNPAPPVAGSDSATADPSGSHLWLLVDRGADRSPRWILENVSAGDYATYRFTGGPEVPGLIGCLLSAPQFSREALYLELADLAGARADLAIPARDLSFLRDLRDRFAGRVIHGGLDRWRGALEE